MPAIDLLHTNHPETLLEIIRNAPLPGLDAGPKCEATRKRVWKWVHETAGGGGLSAAGLWLLAGDLDLSHEVSQANASADGSFWHAIMHRREGDFGNAKYWFRRTAGHPIHQQLADQIAAEAGGLNPDLPLQSLQDSAKLPSTLVDCCQEALGGQPDWVADLQRICWWEWQLLFDHTS